MTQIIVHSDELLEATWNLEADAVASRIDAVHTENTSVLSYNLVGMNYNKQTKKHECRIESFQA